MQSHSDRVPPRVERLLTRLDDDPWSLALDERRAVATALASAHRHWADRLPALVEPPAPCREFPGFLLSLPRFAGLAGAIGDARDRTALDTATADQLQRFVDLFRNWLRHQHPDSAVHLEASSDGSVIGALHTPRRHT